MKNRRRYRWCDFLKKLPSRGSFSGPYPAKPYRPKERVSVDNIVVAGKCNILYLKNFTGDGVFVTFPVDTVLVVKETPWLK
jgi:hypothetical protein